MSTSRRCPLDTCHLLKKVDEKLCFCIDWVPRGRRSDFAPNQYVNWVQAQPAVNWVQAQPALLKKVDENFVFVKAGCREIKA